MVVPASYRKALAEMHSDVLIARRDTENDCIIFYPQEVWNTKVEALRNGLNEWDPQDQLLLMQFIADATEVEMDAQGRVKLPAQDFQQMNMGDDNSWLFVGMLDRFALWKPETFRQRRLSQHELALALKKRFATL